MQRGHSTASEHQRWAGSANGLAACMQHQLRLAENGHGSLANGSHSGLCSDLGSDCPSKGVCTLSLCLLLAQSCTAIWTDLQHAALCMFIVLLLMMPLGCLIPDFL